MKRIDRRDLLALGAGGLLASSSIARAEPGYPSRSVRLLIPFAPGGGQDTFARNFMPMLEGALGQRAVIENKPGGSTVIATEAATRAAPDGYTLLQQTNSFTSNPVLVKRLPFNSQKDLAPISLVARTPHVLIINPKVPVRSIGEFTAHAKASTKRLNYGSSGVGSTNHLAAMMLGRAIGADMEHIVYKGAAESARDVMSGELDLVLAGSSQSTGLARAGRVRALAVTADKRLRNLPDVPTFKELGLDIEIYSWTGYLAPVKTPASIIEKLAGIMHATCRDPIVAARFPEHELLGSSPAEFRSFLGREFAETADLLKNVKVE